MELKHEIEIDENPVISEEPEQEISEAEEIEELEVEVDDENEEGEQEQQESDSEDDALSVSFDGQDDEDDESSAPEWAKSLRKKHRESQKEKRKLEARIKELEGAKEKEELGERPTLESCGYDEDAFADALSAWNTEKANVDKRKQAEREAQEELNAAFVEKQRNYVAAKTELSAKAKDFDDAEEEVRTSLSEPRQAMLLDAVKDPAIVTYALGKNPKKLRELAGIRSDVAFIAEIVRLESKMKVSGVKPKPMPEKRVGGKGGAPISSKTTLERLEREAEKTGDRSKVLAYKRRQREGQN